MLDGKIEEISGIVDSESNHSSTVIGEDGRDTKEEGLLCSVAVLFDCFEIELTVRDAPG